MTTDPFVPSTGSNTASRLVSRLTDQRPYTVRPTAKAASSGLQGRFRAHLSKVVLQRHNLSIADPLWLYYGQQDRYLPVIAWPTSEIQDSVVQVTDEFRNQYALKLGDKVCISREEFPIPEALEVALCQVTQFGGPSLPAGTGAESNDLIPAIVETLRKAEIISVGTVLENVGTGKASFKIASINSSISSTLFRMTPTSSVYFVTTLPQSSILKVPRARIGGLHRELHRIDVQLRALSFAKKPWQVESVGILLHGPLGTGKKLIVKEIAKAAWSRVFHCESDDPVLRNRDIVAIDAYLTKVFSHAHRHQPSLITIDSLHQVAPRSQSWDNSRYFASRLLKLSREPGGGRVLVLGITDRLDDLDEDLRASGCFGFEINIGPPSLATRIEILRLLVHRSEDDVQDEVLDTVGQKTHGFLGKDLYSLINMARLEKINRQFCLQDEALAQTKTYNPTADGLILTDFQAAMKLVHPLALQGQIVDVPKVRWSDIGGQHETKEILRMAIEWPLKYGARVAHLKPKKGMLLYGPPGCSKTLTAKAVANESGFNFLLVNAAAPISMYVGESERKIREIFRKARAASPCIIFFDEFDALLGGSGSDSHSGLKVSQTFLAELDGVEPLQGVFVLAATNKPEVIDPALLRPGRLNPTHYVGLPDLEARMEILKMAIRAEHRGDDVSLDALAKDTEGYSGAEIVDICQRALYAAFQQEIREDRYVKAESRHFEDVLRAMPKGVTEQMLEGYRRWERSVMG